MSIPIYIATRDVTVGKYRLKKGDPLPCKEWADDLIEQEIRRSVRILLQELLEGKRIKL